jgi:hypothetical protein
MCRGAPRPSRLRKAVCRRRSMPGRRRQPAIAVVIRRPVVGQPRPAVANRCGAAGFRPWRGESRPRRMDELRAAFVQRRGASLQSRSGMRDRRGALVGPVTAIDFQRAGKEKFRRRWDRVRGPALSHRPGKVRLLLPPRPRRGPAEACLAGLRSCGSAWAYRVWLNARVASEVATSPGIGCSRAY